MARSPWQCGSGARRSQDRARAVSAPGAAGGSVLLAPSGCAAALNLGRMTCGRFTRAVRHVDRELPFKGGARDALLKAMLAGDPSLSRRSGDEPVLDEVLMRGLVGKKHCASRTAGAGADARRMGARSHHHAAEAHGRAPSGLARVGRYHSGAALGASRDDGVVIDENCYRPTKEASYAPSRPDRRGDAGGESPRTRACGLAGGRVDEAATHSNVAAAPAPAPAAGVGAPAVAGPPHKRASINPFEKKKQIWPLLVIAALGGGGGVYLAVAPNAPPPKPAAEPVAVAPAPGSSTSKPPKKRLSAAEDRDACVVAYFAAALRGNTELRGCVAATKAPRDRHRSQTKWWRPRRGGQRRSFCGERVGVCGGGGVASDLLKIDAGVKGSGSTGTSCRHRDHRRHCCVAAPPLTLPESSGGAESCNRPCDASPMTA